MIKTKQKNRGYGDDKLGQNSGGIERYVGVKRRLVPEYKLTAISLGWESRCLLDLGFFL
jgi:hypothetical protein